jgi:putative transposase
MEQPESYQMLTEQERSHAQERFAVIHPFLEKRASLADLADQHHLSVRTLRRWVRAYEQQGLPGLIRKARSDQGVAQRITPELQHVIEGLALQKPPPTAASIHRQVCDIARQHGWHPPSYRSVALLIQHLNPALVTLAQHGSKVYNDTYDLLYRREAARPNDIWQADHCLLDIWLWNEQGKPARPWLTIIIDDYSRAIAGYFLTFQEPSAVNTALTLRQAIWRKSDPHWHMCGIPRQFYTDHGSDFTSRHLEQVCIDLKMELIFSQVGVPRGRGRIERFFQTVNQLFLCDLVGYAPSGAPQPKPTLTLAAFASQLHTFLVEHYNQRIHGETGVAPQERWEAGGFLPHMPASLEQLDLLLLTVAKPRRVQQDGIRFQGLRYMDLALAAYVGEDVEIRYDPRDMAEIRVYYQHTFVCRAVCQDVAGQTISLKDIQQTRNQRRRHMREQLAERRKAVDTFMPRQQADAPPPGAEPTPDPSCSDREPAQNDPAAELTSSPEPPGPRLKLKRYYNE